MTALRVVVRGGLLALKVLEERGHHNNLDNMGVQEGDVGRGTCAPDEVQGRGAVLPHVGAPIHWAVFDRHREGADPGGESGRQGSSWSPLPRAAWGFVQVDIGVDPDTGGEVGGVRGGEPHGRQLGQCQTVRQVGVVLVPLEGQVGHGAVDDGDVVLA